MTTGRECFMPFAVLRLGGAVSVWSRTCLPAVIKGRMCPENIYSQSRCRLPLPSREKLDADGRRIYDGLANPDGGTLRGARRYPPPITICDTKRG